MMRSLLTLCLLALLSGPAVAQEKRAEGEEVIKVVKIKRAKTVSYAKEVEPILFKRCISCHSGSVKKSNLDLASYNSLIKGGKRGSPIVPGKSADSKLVQFCGKTKKPYMPPKDEDPLDPEELALIKLWIDQGAKAPAGVRVKAKVRLTLLPKNIKEIRAVAVSPDRSAVAAGRANQIHIFDAGSGNFIRTLIAPNLVTDDKKPVKAAHVAMVDALVYSPNGKFLVSGSYQEVAVWDAKTGALRQKLTGFADRVVALAFSPNGKYLATGGGAATEDGEVKVFDTGTWKQVVEIKKERHSDTVFGVAFSPDGTKLASCGADKFVKVFEIPSGKFLKSFEGHTHHVLDVGWKADGKLLASGGADNVVKVWDYAKGEQVRTINAHNKQVTRLVFIGKSSIFATCSGDATIRFWNADNGGNVRNFGGNNDFVYAVSVSPDGKIVAAGGEEGVLRLYNGDNGSLLKSLLPPGDKAAKKK
jgi:WD40 repeat protein